jgi:quinol monooxygenase YgiN
MRFTGLVASIVALLAGGLSLSAFADGSHGDEAAGSVYVIAHLDVLPMTAGGVDFLQQGYSLLFKYRDESKADPGLESFRVLDLAPPTTNHSEIVQAWRSYAAYQKHLAQPRTITFRFEIQNNPRFGGICCVGSPIDDRQYSLVRSFGAPWSSPVVATSIGPADAVFVISYLEFLPQGDAKEAQRTLLEYGEATSRSNAAGILSYSILRELSRTNRYAILEIWAGRKIYDRWQSADATRTFATNIRPMLASPIDHRFTSLCGETYVDGAGCTSP